MNHNNEYCPQTASETLLLIINGVDPWLALGQFLDDWRRCDRTERLRLVEQPPPDAVPDDYVKWGALLAAAVDWLCVQDGFSPPPWVYRSEYYLRQPWFLYPGWRLRAWQLFETPVAFRIRNIFGGDRILSRV